MAQPTVPVGDAVFSVLTTRPAVGGPHKDSSLVAETNGEFSADSLSPGRLSASFLFRHSDAARMAGMSEALRMALASGLSEALDKKIVDQIILDVERTDSSAEGTFSLYRSRLVYAALDGRFAPLEGDLRVLAGVETVAHMASKYRGNSADDSALDSIRRVTGGVRVSSHLPVKANKKADAIVRRGSRIDAVAPIWEGITILPDRITKAASGEVVLTAFVLVAFKVVRTDGFARIENQIEA